MSTFVRDGNQSPQTQAEQELAKMSATDRDAVKRLMDEGRTFEDAKRAYLAAWY